MSIFKDVKIEFKMSKHFMFNGADYECTDKVDFLINKPIIIKNCPIGTITEAVYNEESGLIECKGVIWDFIMNGQFMYRDNIGLTLEAVVLQGEKVE